MYNVSTSDTAYIGARRVLVNENGTILNPQFVDTYLWNVTFNYTETSVSG